MRSLSQLAAAVNPAGKMLTKSARLNAVGPSDMQIPENPRRSIGAMLPIQGPLSPVTMLTFSVRFSRAIKAFALTSACSHPPVPVEYAYQDLLELEAIVFHWLSLHIAGGLLLILWDWELARPSTTVKRWLLMKKAITFDRRTILRVLRRKDLSNIDAVNSYFLGNYLGICNPQLLFWI